MRHGGGSFLARFVVDSRVRMGTFGTELVGKLGCSIDVLLLRKESVVLFFKKRECESKKSVSLSFVVEYFSVQMNEIEERVSFCQKKRPDPP